MTAGSGPLAGRAALSGRTISGGAASGRAVSGSRRSRAGAEIGHALLAACLAAATAAIPLLHEPGFYFRDDAQAYFLPGFLEIARLIRSGEWPFLTPRLFQGGAFLAEYQYGVFNPVCLALYLVLDGFERLDRAAAFYAVFHIGLLGAGTYALGRSIGTGRPFAVLGGLAGATCFGIVDWGAVSWVPGLVSAAWLAWAAAFLMWAGRDGRFVPPAALAVFLVVASGWPFADAALLAGVAAALVVGVSTGGRTGADRRAGIRVMLATGLGFALAAPAWMPLAAAIGSTARLAASFDPHQWQTPLPTLVAIGVPLFPQAWTTFDGLSLIVSPPMHYVGWWIPVALLHGAWSRLRTPEGAGAALLLAATLVLGLLAVAPGVSQLRWPFRFLPYFQIGCAVLGAWFLSRPGHGWSARSALALILGAGVLAGLPLGPAIGLNLALLLPVALIVLILLRGGGPRTRMGLIAIGASHIALFAALTRVFPENSALPDWRPPMERTAYRAEPGLHQGDAALLLFERALFRGERIGEATPALYLAFPQGNAVLHTGNAAIAGYSPMRGKGFGTLCLDYIGGSCADAAERWTRPDPVTGARSLDLARVTRVTAQAGPRAEAFAAAAGAGWTQRSVAGGTLFERPSPALPGTLSRLPDGIEIISAAEGAREARYGLAGAGGRLVWARAWYPGYRAAWNGQPLTVEIVNDILPSVVIPAGTGELVLRYRPRGLGLGLALAALALAALAAWTLRPLWTSRRAPRRPLRRPTAAAT